jgi:hypothetical protein
MYFRAFSRLLVVAIFISAALRAVNPVTAQANSGPVITSPADGQVLQGQVQVKGTTDIPGFSSTELAFAYSPDQTGTWFLIQAASLPATNDVIATWDTTLITDGDYTLRLRVALQDGSFREATETVHIRNYTQEPTLAPAGTPTEKAVVQIPTAMIIVASETPTQAAAPPPTPSALPANPAGVTSAEIYSGFWRGALIVGLLVLGFAALVRLRR